MDPAELNKKAQLFKAQLDSAKSVPALEAIPWYPYGSLDNFFLVDQMLADDDRGVFQDARGAPVADVGAADGDTAFFLESEGYEVDVLDFGPTNYNGLAGVRALAHQLRSNIGIHELDLDARFAMPRSEYGLVLFLGILYHLKNPFYVLEQLAKHCRTMLLSTRITRFDRIDGEHGTNRLDFSQAPVAYLLAPDECNGDATNYWIFSEAGLRRLLDRSGWSVGSFRCFGAIGNSDPSSAAGDERAFCFARSRHFI